jgi:drug/metabolite transporter (DMT)-like permease
MTNIQRGTIIAIACALIFGIYPSCMRIVYDDGGSVVLVIIVTTWARALLLGGYCLARRKPLYSTPQARKLALSGGVLQAISIIGLTASLKYLPGPVALIILFTHTLMLLFFMAWRGKAQLNRWTLGTTVAALLGLAMVLDVFHAHSGGQVFGMALAFAAALATASRLYAFGEQTRTRNPAVVGAETFITAGVLVSFMALFETPHLPLHVSSYTYLAIASASQAFGTFGMFYSIALIGAFRYSLLLKLDPVFGAVFWFLILGQVLKPVQYTGMVVVLGSLATYQIMAHRKAKREEVAKVQAASLL